jgi:hypothetical protein
MPLLPVAAREARGAARAGRNYAWRSIIAGIGLVLIALSISNARNPNTQGRQLFGTLILAAFAYCTIAGVLRTADAIAEEKRENTLGLLFLTDLKAYDVLTGKLLASSATIFFGLLAMLPLMVIPVLMGGVTSQQIVLASLNLLNTLFLSISFGFLMSTLLREAWAAICLGLVAMLFLTLALPQFARFHFIDPTSPFFAFANVALLFSPVSPFQFLDARSNAFGNSFFWSSLSAIHLLGWINILLTLRFLPIVWRDNPRGVRSQAWWTHMQRLRFGGTKTRTRFRTRLLKANPLYWLAGREQVSSSGLMAVLVGIVLISLTGDWRGISFGLVTLHLILLVRMASAASHNLAEDRKSGALELLLATSLSVREVLRGRWMALGRQFFGPMLIVSVWQLFAFVWAILLESYTATPLLIFCLFPVMLLAWVATGWTGMWFGLRSRTPTSAMWMTFCFVLLIPAFLIIPLLAMSGNLVFTGAGRKELEFALGAGIFFWGFYLLGLNAWSSHRLRTSFREAATDRFSALQPMEWPPVCR